MSYFINVFYSFLIVALTFDNFQVAESIKCYYYPLSSKAYRYSTECYYSCCSQPAKSASEACCDSAGSFAALAMMITALICLCCLSCISGILIFVFCFKKKPRTDNSSIISRQMQSVTNPVFTSQNFKLENVNELPKYEDLNLSNLNQNRLNSVTTSSDSGEPRPTTSSASADAVNVDQEATSESQMNEIDLRSSNEISNDRDASNQTNIEEEITHHQQEQEQQQQQTSQV